MSEITADAHPGTTDGVKATPPTKMCRAEKCEIRAHIGIFFDGTGNNQDWVENTPVHWRRAVANWWNKAPRNTQTQMQQRRDSNVARLFRAYKDLPSDGYFPFYINGLGTPFKEIGEDEPNAFGAAFGAGGDGRINYAMLQVLNAMYRSISIDDRPLIGADTAMALCRNGRLPPPHLRTAPLYPNDHRALDKVGMAERGGLLMSANHASQREAFYTEWFTLLEQRIRACDKPRLTEVFIDVFGFSRGAAQARVFCNWLEPFFKGSTLAGVTTHIRFLGLFDSVAAVGVGASATRVTDGHQSWGDDSYLRIPRRVGHCEHYVAMHENRGAFPLEDTHHKGVLPPNVRQYRYPGMHSDVGGGYTPDAQGRCPGRQDSDKLSQIPLNHMFEAARAAKVPLDKDLARQQGRWDCFEASPALRSAYDAFMQANGSGSRPLKDCLLDYLAWRYAVRYQYTQHPATRRANPDDLVDLTGANDTLMADLATLEAEASIDARIAKARSRSFAGLGESKALEEEKKMLQSRVARLSPQAKEILAQVKARRAMSQAETTLFADYCHDSFAGFKPLDRPVVAGLDLPGSWEAEGYLRYRVRYEGDDTRLSLGDKETGTA